MADSSTSDRALNVLIAGAGVGGVEALIALHTLAGKRVSVTLLAPQHDFLYRPLSVGDPFALGPAAAIPVAKIASDFDAELCRDGLETVDADNHLVHTTGGGTRTYDRLIVAVGAERVPAYAHVTTFRGQEDVEVVHGLVQDIEGGYSRRIAFVVPPGVAWSLPLYELALMTARRAFEMSAEVEISLITAEDQPLAVFGPTASGDVRALLDQAGIAFHGRTSAEIEAKGTIALRPGDEVLHVDRIVALPTIRGPRVSGLPADSDGFIPIDNFTHVSGVADVFAVGDGTTFPLKQGGIACQQADVAAQQITRAAGIPVENEPFRAVLRGKLLTGDRPHFMRHDVSAAAGRPDQSGGHNLWWPPMKVAGRYLAPYLDIQAAEGTHAVDVGHFEFASR
jgi:sulfide:quinone oxidoreductase